MCRKQWNVIFENLCHASRSEYMWSTQFRQLWQCCLQNYETKFKFLPPVCSLWVKTLHDIFISCPLTVWIGWNSHKIHIKWVNFCLDLIVFSTIIHRNSHWSLHWRLMFTLRNNPTPFSLYWNYTAVLPCLNYFSTEMNSMMFLIKLMKFFMMMKRLVLV